MSYTLEPYQRDGAQWLARHPRRGAGLFDDMGLGKTATAIAAADLLGAKRILVLAPAIVLFNWRREIRIWSPESTCQVLATGRDNVDPEARFVVTTHSLILRDTIFETLTDQFWDLLILDECHAFKSPAAKRTKRVFRLSLKDPPAIADYAKRSWCLTGTPLPNDPSELWTMLRGTDPVRLQISATDRRVMPYEMFRRRFCLVVPDQFNPKGRVIDTKNPDELVARMDGFGLRRLKSDHLDLPPLRWGIVELNGLISPELLELSQQIVVAAGEIESMGTVSEFSTWRRLCGEAKAPVAVELVKAELQADPKKIVLFCHHKSVAETLRKGLQSFGVALFTGDVPSKQRDDNYQRFQEDPRTRVAVAQIVAGGVGINLTAASDLVFVEYSPVPGENDQAAARCHRMGQRKSVLARVLTLANSVDPVLAEIVTRKIKMIREVLQE